MKKILAATAALMMLCACGKEDKPEPANVIVEMADMNAIKDTPHDECSIEGSEPRTDIVFRTSTEITDVHVLGLAVKETQADGSFTFAVHDLYSQETLTPDSPLVVHLTFFGDLPSYGIRYTDNDGTVKQKYLYISGKDGSLVLEDFE
ncbi:MAG: hypothetical protein E7188_07265 [Erysipelotrichaceae bacterium]|nr:hypothetical protein [Erysipelotrichaceae bacterium]